MPPASRNQRGPSACSGELLCERRQERAAVMVAEPPLEFVAGELALGLDDGALAVRPFGLDRVQPGAPARQAADEDAATGAGGLDAAVVVPDPGPHLPARSEEHTSELQSLRHLVCRL